MTRPFRCFDRMCGATDCANCHPENEPDEDTDEGDADLDPDPDAGVCDRWYDGR